MQPKKNLIWWTVAATMLVAFAVWTVLIKTVDVQATGADGVVVGLSAMNGWWWGLCGANAVAKTISDWLGYLTLLLLVGLAVWQAVLVIRRRSLRLPRHWWVLDGVIVALLACYLIFELVVINGRPLLVDGALKASYPSTHTLLFVVALPLVAATVWRESHHRPLRLTVAAGCGTITVVGVILRAISGVHWLSDIIGGLFLAATLVATYLALTIAPRGVYCGSTTKE